MLSASLLSLVWLPSQRAVCLPCQLQVSLPCPLEASLLSLERVWLLLSSQLALLRLSFRRPVSVPWQLGQKASPLQSSSLRPADPSEPSAGPAFPLLRGEQLALLRGVPADYSYALRLLQNSTLHNLRNRFRATNNYAVNLQCLFRDDSSSNELSLPLTLITRPISYSG